MFFDWKEGLAKDQGVRDVLATYVPEEDLQYSKSTGLIPTIGKAFSAIGSFLYSKGASSEHSLSIRPNEAAFVLRGHRIEGLYYEGTGPQIEGNLKKSGLKFMASTSSMAAFGLYLAETITLPVAAGLSFGAWLMAVMPVLKKGDCRLLLVETTPFEIDLPIGEDPQKPLLTKDKEVAKGSIHSLMKIQVDQVGKLIDLLGSKNYLTKEDIHAGLERDFIHRTLVPHLSTIEAGELRSNPKTHQALETFARSGVAEYYERFGVELERFTIAWDLTETENRELSAKRMAVDQAEKDIQAKIAQRDRERELQAKTTANKIETEVRKEVLESKIEEAKHTLDQESSLKQHILQGRSQEEEVKHTINLEETKRTGEMVIAESEVEKVRLQKEIELARIQQEKANLEADGHLSLEDKKHEAELERKLREAQVKAKIVDLEDNQDLKKLEEMKKIEREDYLTLKKTEAELEINKLKVSQEMELKQKELETQARLQELELKSKLGADQLLAMSAGESDSAAQAMAEKFKSESQKSEDMLRKMSQMMENQMGTVNQMALNYGSQMADVAKSAGEKAGPNKVCASCGGAMEPQWKICPNCG